MHTHLTYNELMNVLPFPPREPSATNVALWSALERFAREGQRSAPKLAPVSILQKESAQ